MLNWKTSKDGKWNVSGPYVIERVTDDEWAVAYYGDPVESLVARKTLKAAKRVCEVHANLQQRVKAIRVA